MIPVAGLARPPADWPTFQAARAFLDGDAAGAAALHVAHGAVRSAALCRLRAHPPTELESALAVFTRIGATRYAHAAERLVSATTGRRPSRSP